MFRLLRLILLCISLLFHDSAIYAYSYPKRIISLGSSITEELFLLGVGERIVGNTIYCTRPEEAKKKEKVGTVVKVNLEKIVELKPDLVLVTSLTDRQQVKKLKDLKINMVEMSQESDFTQICENFLKLGELVGKYKKAQEIVRNAKSKVDFIKNKTQSLTKPKTMVQIGINPLFVATQKYFINDFIEMAGGINIAKDAQTGQYSREEVLRQDPDVIIITTMGIQGEQEKRTWQKYASINAVKNNRIYVFDSYKLCSATPESFVETLKELVKILHPELENE